MSIADVDAERVFRCAYRLEQVAEDAGGAASRIDHASPDDWWGEASAAYQHKLGTISGRVRRMSAAYDAAGAALLPYAHAVLEAQDMLRRAESLLAEAAAAEQRTAAAAAAHGVTRLAGPGLEEGFRASAHRLRCEAAEVEQRAAAVCAAALEDEGSRAPATSRWRSVDRFVGDVGRTGVGVVTGTASLLGSAWSSLPGVGSSRSRHEARDDLVEAGKAAVSVWTIPIEIRDALNDGRPGLAAAALAGAIGPGRLSKLAKQPISKLGRHPIRDVALAHDQALRQVELHARLASHRPWRQTAADMGVNGADLLNEERRGGHALSEHVLVSDEYLWSRVADGLEAASRFADATEAQRAVDLCLQANAARIHEAYALTGKKKLALYLDMPEGIGLVAAEGVDHMVVGHGVRVVLNLEEGEPRVYTAYPTL